MPDLMPLSVVARAVVEGSAGVSVEQAKHIIGQESNGTLTRTSPTQGGRAWLEGEWRLGELEALCLILRHETGDQARGASEFIVAWKDEKRRSPSCP